MDANPEISDLIGEWQFNPPEPEDPPTGLDDRISDAELKKILGFYGNKIW